VALIVGVPAVCIACTQVSVQMYSDLDALRNGTETPNVIASYSRLSRVPFVRGIAERLMAAHWLKLAEADEIDIDPRVAFRLKSVATSPTAVGWEAVTAALNHPLARALEMTYRGDSSVTVAAFSRDTTLVLIGGDPVVPSGEWLPWDAYRYRPTVRVWRTLSGQPASVAIALPEMIKYDDPGDLHNAALSPDHSYVVIAGTDVIRFAALDGRVIKDIAEKNMRVAAISPNSARVATARSEPDGRVTVRVWTNTGVHLADLLEPGMGLIALRFGLSSNELLSVTLDGLTLWNVASGRIVARHGGGITGADFLDNGRMVVASGYSGAELLSVDGLRPLGNRFELDGGVASIAVNAGGTLIALGAENCCSPPDDGSPEYSAFEVRRVSDRTRVCRAPPTDDVPVLAMAFSPDSRRLALVSARGLEVWSVTECRRLGERLAESSYADAFNQRERNIVAFTNDGKHVLTIRGGTARLWRMSFFESPRAVIHGDGAAELLESWLKRTALKLDEQGELRYRH